MAEDVLPKTDEQPEEEPEAASLDDDEDLQRKVLAKLREKNQKGKVNRMGEVQNARDQRLYFKDIQQFYWSEDREDVVFGSDDSDSPYDRTFNVIQGYGKGFISTFMQAKAKVRAEADDPFDSASVRNTAKAQTYERIYRKYNDAPTQQLDIAFLMWTDGRIITRTENRSGKEITTFWGVLEARVPVAAKDDIEVPLKNCPLIELEDEYPMVQLKAQYGDQKSGQSTVRKCINSGNGDSYERNARIAVKRQAGSDTSIDVQTGEDAAGMATKTWSYMRPEFFEDFEEAERTQLQEMFQLGLCVVHNGDVYLESYEVDIDSVLDVIHALPGDGMSRGSIGKTSMALQDSANTAQNLIEETFDHGIPTTYYDTKTNIDGLNNQREAPGMSRKMLRSANEPAGNSFFQTPAINPSAQLLEYVENVKGPQTQFASGQQPALFGGEMEDQKTASGYAQAKNQALGQMTIVWKPFTAWFTREMTRAVRMASKRPEEIKATLPPQRKGGKPEATRISPSELLGLSFTNESDENFPETWTEKSNKFMQLLQMGGDIADMILDEEPDNLYIAKQMFGLEEIVIPGEDLRNMVLADIAQMENDPLTPDPAQMPQQALPAPGQPAPQISPVSPIKIDTDYLEDKDFEIGFKTVKRWVQSSTGQSAKDAKPNWYQNVKLYGLQYKQGMEAAQAAKAPAPEPPDLPKVAIPYDSLPISGKIQAAGKAGIQLTPQDIQSVPPQPTGAA